MVDATDSSATSVPTPSASERLQVHPARLARCAGELSHESRGWTWRGRLPAEAVADLLRRAFACAPLTLEGPADAPTHVWLRAVWFDAAHRTVACELVAGDDPRATPATAWSAAPGGPGSVR